MEVNMNMEETVIPDRTIGDSMFTIQVVQLNGVTHNYGADNFQEAVATAERHLSHEYEYASHYRIFKGDFGKGAFLVAEKYGVWKEYEIRDANEL
jgi:hypothetical protein